MKGIKGEFGFHEERFGLNAMGGMDKEEIDKYLFNSIIPCFPDVMDKLGKRMLIKI